MRPAANLVFLVDTSGSMNEPNKLPLVQQSLRLLLGELDEQRLEHVEAGHALGRQELRGERAPAPAGGAR